MSMEEILRLVRHGFIGMERRVQGEGGEEEEER